MTTDALESPAMRDRLAALRAALDQRPLDPDAPPADAADRRRVPRVSGAAAGPLVLADRVVVRRDRRRPGRGRPPHPVERRRQPGRAARADGRDRARGRRAGAPALDRCRCSTRRWASAGADVGRRRRRRGDPRARASPARCSSGSTSPRRSPGSTTSRSCGVNHLEGHVYAAWLRDPGQADGAEPEFPLVALVVSGGHTFLVEMTRPPDATGCSARRSTTRRARRSTRSAACSASTTRAARRSSARPRARAATTRVFPRAWLGDSYDFSFSGLKTAARRTVEAARADAGLPRAGGDPAARADRRARVGLPGGGRRRARRPRRSAPRAPRARARSCSAAASRPTAVLRARLAGEAEALGVPLIVPRPGLCTDNGAMIGAAGARRFAPASAPASTSRRRRRCRCAR